MQENSTIKNKKHKWMIICIIISFVISALQYLYSLKVSWYGTLTSWLWLFIPAIALLVINFILSITSNKAPKASKIIGILLNFFIIVVVQLFFCGLMTLFFASLEERPVTEVKDYNHALSSIGIKKQIKHFPQNVPDNAQNVELKKEANNWFGSEEIFLAFDIDDKYIQQELSKYKFVSVEGPYDEINKYYDVYRSLYPNDLEKTGYKVYYINKGDPYYAASGIAVKNNRIMYFYNYPD